MGEKSKWVLMLALSVLADMRLQASVKSPMSDSGKEMHAIVASIKELQNQITLEGKPFFTDT
jgi:hypothetical protein